MSLNIGIEGYLCYVFFVGWSGRDKIGDGEIVRILTLGDIRDYDNSCPLPMQRFQFASVT